jgi:hypothetical protein
MAAAGSTARLRSAIENEGASSGMRSSSTVSWLASVVERLHTILSSVFQMGGVSITVLHPKG